MKLELRMVWGVVSTKLFSIIVLKAKITWNNKNIMRTRRFLLLNYQLLCFSEHHNWKGKNYPIQHPKDFLAEQTYRGVRILYIWKGSGSSTILFQVTFINLFNVFDFVEA